MSYRLDDDGDGDGDDCGLRLYDERALTLAPAGPDDWSDVAGARAGVTRVREGEHRAGGPIGFFDLPRPGSAVQPEGQLARMRAWADGMIRRAGGEAGGNVKDVLWIGLGGSGLGPRLIVDALVPPLTKTAALNHPRPTVRFADNLEPDAFGELLTHLDPWRTHVVVVSKSGSTAESTMLAGWAVQWLQAAGAELKTSLTLVTDPDGGVLHRLAGELGIAPFAVPPSVGGRWSVLSPVGLLPAAVIGADIDALLAGARAVDDDDLAHADPDGAPGLAARWGSHLLRALRQGKKTVPFVVYNERLQRLGGWAQQLLMESIGKRVNRAGEEVRAGLTVVAARGTSDQHSMLQEWLEGPLDKFATFVAARPAQHGPTLPPLFGDDELAIYQGRTPAEVQLAMYRGTADALAAAGVPSATLAVSRIDEASVGALLHTLELGCALAAEGLQVDAYDQPGVALGKARAKDLLAARAAGEALDDELGYLLSGGEEAGDD